MLEEKKRLQSINEIIADATHNRMLEIDSKKIRLNKESIAAHEKYNSLYSKLEVLLPKEHHYLLEELDEAATCVQVTDLLLMYRQGLRDGVAFPKAWGVSL